MATLAEWRKRQAEYKSQYYKSDPDRYERHKARMRDLYRRKKAGQDTSRKALQGPQVRCTHCQVDKPAIQFRTISRGPVTYLSHVCAECTRNQRQARRLNLTPEAHAQLLQRSRDSRKSRRIADVPQAIYEDCRKSDRKLGLINDLTKAAIEGLIAGGCRYCGETHIRMTLDRIDNHLGHSLSNVVPACLRCNLIRRDMPYAAWTRLASAIRSTREAGLFGTWLSSPLSARIGSAL